LNIHMNHQEKNRESPKIKTFFSHHPHHFPDDYSFQVIDPITSLS